MINWSQNLSSTNSYRLLDITKHPKDTASPCTDQKQFLFSFSTAFWSQTGRKKQSGRKRIEKVDKCCIWSTNDKTILLLLECSVMLSLNYQLEIVGEEFATSIDHSDKFYVNLLFDRSIHRPLCKHMGYCLCIDCLSFVGLQVRCPMGYLADPVVTTAAAPPYSVPSLQDPPV